MKPAYYRRTRFWLVVALLVLVAGGFVAWKRNAATASPARTATTATAPVLELLPSDLTTVTLQDIRRVLPLTGTVRAVNQAAVKARVGGTVREVMVREGEAVKAGQILVEMDETEYRARLAQARGALAAAQGQLNIALTARDNNRALLAKGFISRNAFETTASQYAIAKANVDSAKGAFDVAQESLKDTVIRAPIGGLISSRTVQPGEKVSPDNRLLDIIDLSEMELEAPVPAQDIAAVAAGQQVDVQVEGVPQKMQGRIVRINPATEAGSRSIPVYVRIDNPEGLLRSGMFAEALLTVARRDDVLAVPRTALRAGDTAQATGQETASYVYVVEDGTIKRRNVKTGLTGVTTDGPSIEIAEGLAAGVQVIRNNLGNFPAGATVRIAQSPAAALATQGSP